ncbi:MAG: triose-phosphate isomerase [Dehalococcoidales bacterium]|nr:triose-phosphate isomerase [Dehalococcoidales bacterium]
MKRKPLIAGNWKMNTTTSQAIALVKEMLPELEKITSVEVAICPPFVSLAPVYDLLASSCVYLGAQNMYFEEKGAFTGEVSATMLKPFCKYVIIGHSERRQLFAESNEIINQKLKQALQAGIIPILCLGETLKHRQAGVARETITSQLKSSLGDIRDIGSLVIAYEPIWAIGSGINAEVSDTCLMMDAIRTTVSDIYGQATAANIRLLYGGSVNSQNASDYLASETIDGALVGGASLKAEQFISIVKQAERAGG